MISVTGLTAEQFRASPQVGMVVTLDEREFFSWLTTPAIVDDKTAAGAWCPCALPGGIVKGGSGPVSVLALDNDTCGPGGLDRTAHALASYAGVVVPTFSATRENEKNRPVLRLTRDFTADEFRDAWPFMQRALAASGITIDRMCRNINRLYYAPATRSPDAWLGARVLVGRPLDVDALVIAARRDAASRELARIALPTITLRDHGAYLGGVLRHATEHIGNATAGERHLALIREAYSLARFVDLADVEIFDALLPSFVAAAGEARRREGERSIGDAIRARRGRAA